MRRFALPIVAAIVVAALSTLLLGIGARSPYTHANLAPQFDARYTRTSQALVGPPEPYHGGRPAPLPAAIAANQEARGRVLLVVKGCAACHGIDGRGSAVGPAIAGFGLDDLREKAWKGPGGMPTYSALNLSDEDLAAIAAYLRR
ncbi:MAG: cytochrome c [Chloroflexi bacterium]|nr:cytochrome c [Chloroflexota bacterium]